MRTPAIEIKDKTASSELLKVSPFRKEIRKTNPHRHNSYFEIIYLSAGAGFHTMDHYRFRLAPPMIFLVRQDQLHSFDLEEEADGFVAIIKKKFIQNAGYLELKSMISRLSEHQCVAVQECATIELLFTVLVDELKQPITKNEKVVESTLKALIAKMLVTFEPVRTPINGVAGLYDRFLFALQNEQQFRNSVHHDAALLHTSPQNLNAACRKAVGQSAAQVLATTIVAEAKRLLRYTSLSVAEIAFHLNFSDASNFVKYFRRNADITPQKFRTAQDT